MQKWVRIAFWYKIGVVYEFSVQIPEGLPDFVVAPVLLECVKVAIAKSFDQSALYYTLAADLDCVFLNDAIIFQ